ncbi:unnamed protein product [Acanthoscelides obtectus]|uniref:G-patch domain-containing protein n=1 Tax=Acanthoscelides obtectus TaxID=200917 RepID=A0A9P0KL75_ACAOB|nr:unnamed protein product [Acanthoscelides obtectus]CAK1660727.1 PIN2/TERF1-interacting telomerase inhibitor 1 [Acanthoscelides obtectus]
MSMLAEKRRKTKYSLNPRGNQWAQDSNKFGQKILERMGWKHGKGLGAKENGITEHVKVSYKNDSKGMGYKGNDEQWTEHEDKFAALLSSLTGETESKPVAVSSLEKKSQSSKARVHYMKYTRGKDLSRYSEKDLACIFGKRSLKEDGEIAAKVEEPANNEYLINSGSMADYFKKKLPNFNSAAAKSGSESESELSHSFGFGFNSESVPKQEKTTFVSYLSENKRKAEDEICAPKKKSKKEIKQEQDLGVANPAFNPLSTLIKVERHVLETIEESIDEDALEVSTKICYEVDLENSLEQGSKKKKKHKKKDKHSGDISCSGRDDNTSKNCGKDNTNFSCALDDSVTQSSENPYEVKRKKSKDTSIKEENPFEVKVKKRKLPKFAVENSQFKDIEESSVNDNTENIPDNPHEFKIKKKKSKFVVENLAFDPSMNMNDISAGVQENPYEVKVTSKKKKSLNGIENSTFDASIDSNATEKIEEKPYEVKVKNKRPKFAIENPSFDMNKDPTLENSVSVEENPYEVKTKKKKTKFALENPCFDMNPDSALESSVTVEEHPYEVKVKNKKHRNTVTSSGVQLENSGSTHEAETLNSDRTNVSENSREVKTKKKKKQKEIEGKSNPELKRDESINSVNSEIVEDEQLMLNVAVIPVEVKADTKDTAKTSQSVKRSKSVRFSNVIIQNNEHIKTGIDNECFDKQKSMLDENMQFISQTIDRFEAEIENDLNEEKQLMVGEIRNPAGQPEKLPDGTTRLKFKDANLGTKTATYHLNKTGAKKSYKHLIKGDIVLKFKETNLHEISGYAAKKETLV